jgi:uncharacterized membrane protein YdjX (TVP38/TMEM64 family)
MKQLILIFFLLALLVVIPFLIWGGRIEQLMSMQNTVAWLESSGRWAWAFGLGLLILDLFLPILGTVVMSALGLIYGWFLGGLLSALGAILAGLLAYGLARRFGPKAISLLTGDSQFSEGKKLFSGNLGGWLIAVSRWMPILPEVMACLAGVSQMPLQRFIGALVSGCLPLGFVFAWIGHTGTHQPILALTLSVLLPPIFWGLFHLTYRKKMNSIEPNDAS